MINICCASLWALLSLGLLGFLRPPSEETVWMEEYSDYIVDRPLNQVVIPGTHISGSYGVNKNSKLCPGDFLEELHPIIRKVGKPLVINYTKTQVSDVVGQLHAGVRFLDIYLCKVDGVVYSSHGYLAYPFSNFLQGVKIFANAHPQEIITLNFREFFGFTGVADHKKLFREVLDALGHRVVSRSLYPSSVVGKFWRAKKNVILVYDYKKLGEYSKLYWPSSWSHFHQTKEMRLDPFMIEIRKQAESVTDHKGFHILLGTRVPDPQFIKSNFAGTLEFLSRELNPVLTQRYEQTWKSLPFNVILFDMPEEELIRAVIRMNKILPSQKEK